MSTSTMPLLPFRVTTVANHKARTITVVAKNRAAAAAIAALDRRAEEGLPRNAAVLTHGLHPLANTVTAPPPITGFERHRNAQLARAARTARS